MTRTLFRAAILAACLPLLSGCVAALVPVIASGTLLGKEQLKSKDDEREVAVAIEDSAAAEPAEPEPVPEVVAAPAPAPTPVAAISDPDLEAGATEVAVEELSASQIATPVDQMAEIERPSPDFIGPVDSEQGEATQREVELAVAPAEAVTPEGSTASKEPELPATAPTQFADAFAPPPNLTGREPTPELVAAKPVQIAMAEPSAPAPELAPKLVPTPRAPTVQSSPTDFRAYDALYSYVESQARRDPVKSPRQSALLAAPGSLSPIRTECSIRPPAILVDLDPGDRPFDATITPQANPSLGQILTSFRLQEIEIFWISQQSAISAGAIRKALVASGLDPQGRDGLLLMRSADDRKQARRKELSETHCLLAIGGDTRSDFDELYLYLKEETAAQPLEELIGAGWFLTPLPLTEGQ